MLSVLPYQADVALGPAQGWLRKPPTPPVSLASWLEAVGATTRLTAKEVTQVGGVGCPLGEAAEAGPSDPLKGREEESLGSS